MPDDNQQSNTDIYQACLQHLVGLSVQTNAPGDVGCETSPGNKRFILSGCIFAFGDLWVLATAGHVINDLNKILDHGHRLNIRLIDNWGFGPVNTSPIPFEYDPKWTYAIDEMGLDFGFIRLHHNTKSILEAKGIKPVDEKHWLAKPDDEKFSMCATLGIPTETQVFKKISPEDVGIELKPLIIKLEHVFDVPEELAERNKFAWHGRISKKTYREIKHTLNGISGGPVFGFNVNEEGQVWYLIIGLQHAVKVHGDHAYFIATPFYTVGQLLIEFRKQIQADGR